MNHVYRLIWNTSLGCWMVASEHTRSRGKRSSAARGLVAAAMLALSMPVGASDALGAAIEEAIGVQEGDSDRAHGIAPLTVRRQQVALFSTPLLGGSASSAAPRAPNRFLQATFNDTYSASPTLNGENSLVLGSRASVIGGRSTGIGNEVVTNGSGHTALGSKASATGRDAVAIGINALAAGTGNVSIGEAARAETGPGIHAVAIGALARAGSPGWTGAVAVGGETTATQDGIALGYKANANNYGAMSLGREAVGNGQGALAVGRYANAQANGTIAIGEGAQAPQEYAIAVGSNANAYGAWSIALGMKARAAEGANAIGYMAEASGRSSVGMGWAAWARGEDAVAIGTVAGVVASAPASVAIGVRAKVDGAGSHAVALGADALASAVGATALGTSSKAQGNHSIALGNSAQSTGLYAMSLGRLAKSEAEGGIALGNESKAVNASAIALGTLAQAKGNQSLAVGLRAKADGQTAMVIGMDAQALGSYTTAVGHQAQAIAAHSNALGYQSKAGGTYTNSIGYQAEAMGSSSVAIGSLAKSTASHSIAVGDRAQVNTTAASSLALGHSSTVNAGATNAVALGAGSVATAANTVSVGSATMKRKVVNVADGALSATSAEAVTGKQLFATNQNVTTATNTANAAKTTADAAKVDATAALTKANLVSGLIGQVSAAGNVRVGAENTGTVLDVRNKTNANRTVSGVADGALSATSAEAVTGKQLFATNQNVTTATNTANTAKTTADAAKVDATAALDKATVVSGLIGQVSAAGNVRVGAENTGTVLDVRNKANANRTVSGVADGALSAASTDAVTGKQLFATNQLVTANGVAIADNRRDIGVNRDDLDTLRDDFDNYAPDLSGVVRYNADRTLVDLGGAGVIGLADGEISATSTNAVNGSQLFGTNERVEYLEQQQRYVMVGADESSLPAQAGNLGVAVGGGADAREEGATAVGSFATAKGRNSVALGRAAYVAPEGRDGFALGTRTRVQAVGGLAIGADSDVIAGADQSVALGNASVAKEANTVAVGNDGLKRRIVHVARGTNDDNATSLVQLRETVTALGGGAAIDATGQVIAPNYMLSGDRYTNVGDALTFLDTKLVSHQSELDTLDSRYQSLVQNDRSIRYNEDRSVVDFGGATVTGVAAGTLSADSSDAVNGAQLFATNERVGGLEDKQRYVMVGANESSLSAQAGSFGVAVGGDADARADGATAIGSFSTALATNSVALGRGSYVASEARNGFALGSGTRVQSEGGLAIGADADVMSGAHQSVALGVASVATEANTVSVGSGDYRRRIVNVGQGIRASDATTVSQLRGALDALGGGAALDANGNVVGPRIALHGGEYRSYSDALTALDNNVVDGKRNLDSLDNRFQRLFQESPSANADAAGRLTLGGAQGMVLGNVANGLIGQGSRDAVNGGQLWAVKQDLQGQIDALDPNGQGANAVAMNARSAAVASDTPTPPAADAGTPPAAPDAVVTAEGDNAVAVGSEGKERAVKHVAEGRADTDAANVRQVNEAMERANEYTDAAVAGVNQRLDHMDKRINRMAAISSAQSAMAMNTAGLATTNRLGAGVGYAEGESALSVGYQRVLNERGSATFSLNGAFTNSGERSVGVGMGIGW